MHFLDNSKLPLLTFDRLLKIRDLVDRLRKNLNNHSLELYLCVDVQVIILFKGNVLKQYNFQKSKKWGYKLFCLAEASGIMYDFVVLAGPETYPQQLSDIGQRAMLSLFSRVNTTK